MIKLGKRVFSASQFKQFYSCNKQWAFSKIEGIPIQPNLNMEIGNLVHRTIELFNENHDPISMYNAETNPKKAIENHIKTIAKENVFKEREFNGFKDKMMEDEQTIYILNLLENYADYIYENYQRLQDHDYYYEPDTECFDTAFPDESELKLTLLDDTGSWYATSTIDAVYEKSPLFSYDTVIIDYKTKSQSKKCFADIGAGNELQLEFYAWLFYQIYGVVPDGAGIHFVGTNPKEEYPIVMKDIGFHDIIATDNLIRKMEEKTESNDIEDYKRNEEYQWCGEDYCDHYDYCLGDKEIPEDVDGADFEGEDRDPVEATISKPDINELTYASNSDKVLC